MNDAARIPADRQRLPRSTYRLAFVFVVLVMVLTDFYYVNYTCDDSFIVFRYAENIARGKGWVFTAGERVEAYTSFTWTGLLALAAVLGAAKQKIGLVIASKVLGATFGLGAVLGVAATAPLVSAPRPCRTHGAVAVAFLLCSAPFALWSVTGLETSLVACLLSWAVYFELRDHLVEVPRSRWPRSALLFAVGALTRPEFVFSFAATGALRLVLALSRPTFRARWRSDVLWLAAFVVPCGVHLLWRHAYYGQWLPNTYYAKVAGDALTWPRGHRYVRSAIVELGLWPSLLAATVPFAVTRRAPLKVVYLSTLLLVHLFVVALEGGDWMPVFRFIIPILPIIALLVDAAVSEAYESFTTRSGRAMTSAVAILALANVGYRGVAAVPTWLPEPGFEEWAPVPADSLRVARWMNDHLPHRGLLALGEAGVIPYYTELPVLDLFGLADPHIAHLPGARHHKFDLEYVLGRLPSYVVLAGHHARGAPPSGYTYVDQLLGSSRFSRDYRLVADFPAFVVYVRSEVSAKQNPGN